MGIYPIRPLQARRLVRHLNNRECTYTVHIYGSPSWELELRPLGVATGERLQRDSCLKIHM